METEEDDDIMIIHSSIDSHDEIYKHINCGIEFSQAKELEYSNSGCDLQAAKTWIYPTNYPVRNYQYNIAKAALFQNTLVCLPTGLGKTFIAAVLMYNYYRWFPTCKIVFMAPTKPLVNQQIEACFNIMGIPQEHTGVMTGMQAPEKRSQSWQKHRVLFLTPHVLENDLSSGLCLDKSIKLVVVDEAHKALGEYAYCHVIKLLKAQNYEFRVLALSATPGSDIIAVQKVISNLLISHIELRGEESLDIREYTHERKLEKIVVKIEGDVEDTKIKFFEIILPYVQRLKDNKVLFTRDEHTLTKFQILKFREAFRQNPPINVSNHQKGILEGSFAICMSLYHALELLIMHGIRSFYNFLKGIMDNKTHASRGELTRNSLFTSLMNSLSEKYEAPLDSTKQEGLNKQPMAASHPKIEKLKEVVIKHFEHYEEEHLSTRVMIFSQYRDSVAEITEQLSHCGSLIKPMCFIGHSSSGKGKKGFSQSEQLKVVKQFKEGDFNTLISTCVGEEGLDIGDVDLIVCYDVLKSPIRLVQRMGRTGRKREGRIIILVTEGREEQMYMESHYKKKSLSNAITNGNRLARFFYQENARMIPQGLNPECVKMKMAAKTWNSLEKTKKEKNPKSIASYFNNQSTASKAALKKSGVFLNPEENSKYIQSFRISEDEQREIKPLPPCRLHSLAFKNADTTLEVAGPAELDLGHYQPWQTALQSCSKMSHSLRSKHLVELTEFVNLQVCLGSDNDSYRHELAPFLNMDDFAAQQNLQDSRLSNSILQGNKKRKKIAKKSLDISSYMKKGKSPKELHKNKDKKNLDSTQFHKKLARKIQDSDNLGNNNVNDDLQIIEDISPEILEIDNQKDRISKDNKSNVRSLSPTCFENLPDVFNYVTPKKDSFLYIKQPPTESPLKDSFIDHKSAVQFARDFNDKMANRWKMRFGSLFTNFVDSASKGNNVVDKDQITSSPISLLSSESFKSSGSTSIVPNSPIERTNPSFHIPAVSEKFFTTPLSKNIKANGTLALKESQLEVQLKHKRKPEPEPALFQVSPIIKRRPPSQLHTSTPIPQNARKLFAPVDVTPIQKNYSMVCGLKDITPNFQTKKGECNKRDPEIAVNFELTQDLFPEPDNLKSESKCSVHDKKPPEQNDHSHSSKLSSGKRSNSLLTETQVIDFLNQSTPQSLREKAHQPSLSSHEAILSCNKSQNTVQINSSTRVENVSDLTANSRLVGGLSLQSKKVHRKLSDQFLGLSFQEKMPSISEDFAQIPQFETEGWIDSNKSFDSKLPMTQTSKLPSSRVSKLPSSQNSKLPSSQVSKLPSSQNSKLPSSQVSKLPSPQTSKLPSSQVSKLPPPQTSKLPSSQVSKLPLLQTSKLPSSQTSRPPKTSTSDHQVSFDIGFLDFEEWNDDNFIHESQDESNLPSFHKNAPNSIPPTVSHQNLPSTSKNQGDKGSALPSLKCPPLNEDRSKITTQNLHHTSKKLKNNKELNFSNTSMLKFSSPNKQNETLNDTDSPINFKRKFNGILISSDDDGNDTSTSDSPLNIVKLKRRKENEDKCNNKKSNMMHGQNNISTSFSASDDDFQDTSNKFIQRKINSVPTKKQTNKNKKRVVDFIDLEADVSLMDKNVSSDESEEDLDCMDQSFVDDLTQPTQQVQEMKAVYLQSVRSPLRNHVIVGKSKIGDTSLNEIEESDVGESEDSFVVDNDFVEYETEHFGESFLAEDPIINKAIAEKAKKKPPETNTKKRKRIISSIDSETENESEVEMIPPTPKKESTSRSSKLDKVNFDFGFDLLAEEDFERNSKGNSSNRKSYPPNRVNMLNKGVNIGTKMSHVQNISTSKVSTLNSNLKCDASSFLGNVKSKNPQTSFTTNKLLDSPSNKDFNLRPQPEVTRKNSFARHATESFVSSRGSKVPSVSPKKNIFKRFSSDMNFATAASSNASNKGTPLTTSERRNEWIRPIQQQQWIQPLRKAPKSTASSSCTTSSASTSSSSRPSSVASQSPASLFNLAKGVCILIDSSEVSVAGLITSKLRLTHGFNTHVTQLSPACYVISNRVAILRQTYSNFSSTNNKSSFIKRIQELLRLYERPFVIVEADSGLTIKNVQRSLYIDTISCACAQLPQIKIVYSDNRDDTAQLIAKLAHLERHKGHAIPLIQQDTKLIKFYRNFPKINCASAIFLSKNFLSVREFLNSSAEVLMKKGHLTRSQAASILSHIKRNFRRDMLPETVCIND